MADALPIKDPLQANKMSPPGIAPIAKMDSEDDWTARSLGVESDTSLLFNLNTVAEILEVITVCFNSMR